MDSMTKGGPPELVTREQVAAFAEWVMTGKLGRGTGQEEGRKVLEDDNVFCCWRRRVGIYLYEQRDRLALEAWGIAPTFDEGRDLFGVVVDTWIAIGGVLDRPEYRLWRQRFGAVDLARAVMADHPELDPQAVMDEADRHLAIVDDLEAGAPLRTRPPELPEGATVQ